MASIAQMKPKSAAMRINSLTVTPGQQFGRWTILGDCCRTSRGEKNWLCRCQCGTEKYVLERSLRHGSSLSCGCMRREAAFKAVAHDLTGQTFGELTVLKRIVGDCREIAGGPAGNAKDMGENRECIGRDFEIPKKDRDKDYETVEKERHKDYETVEKENGKGSGSVGKYGGVYWHCRCSCGNICQVKATLLVTGRKTHCGCKAKRKPRYTDITGKSFGRLTAMYPTENRGSGGGVVWHCRCDCGREVEVPYNSLMYANQCSCGCQKKEHDQMLRTFQTRVDGTSLDIIKSKKLPTDNTTGHKGVYLIRGKYVAKIVLQKRVYYLGTYESIEEAIEARKAAEETLYQATVDFYAKWQKRAEKDPEWAKENPMKILADKRDGRLQVDFLPQIV